MQERVQKFLSEAGIASRRKAEDFIRGGHVTVNGKAVKLGDKMDPDKDVVKVFGKLVKKSLGFVYLALNKPKGYVVSKRDPQGRKTVFELLPVELRSKVWNVGRLDYNTEGLLLFTNDGDLTQKLSHPSFEHEKEYEVMVNESPTETQLEHLRTGVELPSGLSSPAKVKVRGSVILIAIHEGKKHQVRRMFDAVGLSVKSLKRIRMGKLKLPNLQAGHYTLITKEQIL